MISKKLHFIIYISLTFTILGCKKEIQPIVETKNNISEIEKLIAIGEKFYESAKYDSSYYYFNKAKLACNPETDAKHYIYSISNLATIQQNQGDYSGSEATAMEAMPILETTTNPKYKWNIYTILGINYLSTYDYNSALNYFNSALDLKTDESRNNATLNNIALTYMEQGEYQKALKILLPLALDHRIKDNPTENSQIINNIGHCYFKTGNSKSINFLTRSLKIRTALKNDWILITSYYNLSLFYEKYNLNLSRKYAQLSYDKATSLNNVGHKIRVIKTINSK